MIPVSARRGGQHGGLLPFLLGRLEYAPVRIPGQLLHRHARKYPPPVAGTRNRDQHREDRPPLGLRQLVAHVPVQHDGVSYLQLGRVVVGRHARVPQEREQVRGGALKRPAELVALAIGGCHLQNGPLQVQALGAAGRLPPLDPLVQGEQPAVA